MKKIEYTERLRALLNEVAEDGLEEITLLGTDTVNLSAIIEETYPLAWEHIAQEDLISMSIPVEATPLATYGSDSQVGYIDLPDDFHKLTCLKMQGWKIPVTQAYSRSSEVGMMQGYHFARGNTSRPVAIIENIDDNQRLYYYSVKLGAPHIVELFTYVPSPDIDRIDVKSALIPTLLLWHAVHIGIALNRHDLVKYYTDLIQGIK